MAAPTFDGIASDAVTADADTSIVVTAPAGSGGRLYAVGACASTRTLTPPAGWTEEANDSDGTARVYLWQRADDAAGSYTFTASAGFSNAVATVFRLGGAGASALTDAYSTGPNGTSQTCPTITTPAADCLVFWGYYRAGNSGPASADKGDERLDFTQAAPVAAMGLYSQPVASAGSVTGAVITTTGFGAKRVFSFAVEPAAAPAGGGSNLLGDGTLVGNRLLGEGVLVP